MFMLINMGVLEKEEQKGIFKELEKQTKATASTLDNLLFWARNQLYGDTIFDLKKFNLNITVKEVFDFFISSARLKGLSLENEIEDNVFLFADINMVRLILRNLIANAIKFSSNDDKIVITSKMAGDNMTEVWVKDSGVGMTQETIERLFNKDKLYSTVGTGKEKGTGLGLILVEEYVEKHGGKIWIESKEGVGSIFKFTIPISKD